ncbi:Gfo/Idh/MocA family oxidoreductase [Virgibacillus necropolis]|uniref:Gfo/Idh/MocA family protein n=1 Tax=Virgibacillus necropolis TaxID=163877 RepID=UPI00385145D2
MNFATIGTSRITASFIEAAKETKGFTLTAVYSRSVQKAKDFAKIHGAENAYTDLEQLAKSNEVECVYIASPNSLHFEQAILFLKHKKHVICEKPIFSNTKELSDAYKVAEENNVYLFEAVRNIHSPNFQRLKEGLPDIGKVRSMMLHRSKYSSRYDQYLQGETPNIFSADFSGGALVDLGVYPLYIAVTLFGKPQGISYHPVMLESGVDGNGTLVLTYEDFTSTIICSKISNSFNSCEIHGEEGTLRFDNAGTITDLRLIKIASKEKVSLETVDWDLDMIFEVENFMRIIETNDDQEYNRLKDLSLSVLSITEAARKQNCILYKNEK